MNVLAVAPLSIAVLLSIGWQLQSPGAQDAPVAALKIRVDASHPWVDSGLTVHKGERLLFQVEGTIQWGAGPDQVAGPEGHGAKPGKLGTGGLIGRVGSSGKPFAVGNTRAPFVMPKSGRLFLGINDFVFGDNKGAFSVSISRAPAP